MRTFTATLVPATVTGPPRAQKHPVVEVTRMYSDVATRRSFAEIAGSTVPVAASRIAVKG